MPAVRRLQAPLMGNPRPTYRDQRTQRMHENMDLMDAGYKCSCTWEPGRIIAADPNCVPHADGPARQAAIAATYPEETAR